MNDNIVVLLKVRDIMIVWHSRKKKNSFTWTLDQELNLKESRKG